MTWSSSDAAIAAVNATTGEVEGKTAAPSITWATGNLVADGANGVKVDAATYTGSTSWNSSWIGDPATENAETGTGDPCKYYLKGNWHLPTKDEYVALFEGQTEFSSTTSPWKWENFSAINNTKGLTFPASGLRDYYDGTLFNVGTIGSYWSASPVDAGNGYFLDFANSEVDLSSSYPRALGCAVRCVKDASN